MTELKQILTLDRSAVLIEQLRHAGYAFAAWRMPESSIIQLAISLNEVKKQADFSIAESKPGFVVNRYDDNHAIAPFLIEADILVTPDEIKIHPNIDSSKIDQFKQTIKEIGTENKVLANPNQVSERDDPYPFTQQVQMAIDEIKQGTFEKVVLSRSKDILLNDGFNAWDFFESITGMYPNAFCNLSFIPGHGMWIGATPELLISETENRFQTVALAGTKSLEIDQSLGEIAWTQKEIEELSLIHI